MKTKLLTIAMMVALMLAAITRGQAQQFDGPCLPQMHGLDGHQSALCGFAQTIALSAGTNWFSSNVEITLADLQDALVEALPGVTGMAIQAKDGKTTSYTNGRWRGQLTTLDVASMYKIKVSAACEIVLTGMPIDPAAHPVTIVANAATWMGFPLSESMTLTDAFAGFAVPGDKVIFKGSSASYSGGRWRGQLSSLEPGKGYIYKSASTVNRTFTFPSGVK